MEINKELAAKVLETVDFGLCSGVGEPVPGKMCVEAAVNYAMGREHGDEPSCVGAAVRRFKIELNDANWSSNLARAAGMRKIAIAQLGSDKLDQIEFARKMAIRNTQVVLPVLFRKLEMEEIAKRCEDANDLEYAESAAKYAESAAESAEYAAEYAAKSAAKYAAESAKYAAKYDAEYDPDYFFKLSAQVCLDVLIDMNSTGCEFLFLCDGEK